MCAGVYLSYKLLLREVEGDNEERQLIYKVDQLIRKRCTQEKARLRKTGDNTQAPKLNLLLKMNE